MKRILQIATVLLLSYAAAYAINYWLFDDTAFFTAPKIVTWLLVAALVIYLFVWGDLKPKDEPKK